MEEVRVSNSRPIQEAQDRSTERRPAQGANQQTKAAETRRARGRPKGSSNKAKALIPKELANEILLVMKDTLPPEHYEYIRGVVREGKAVSAKHEAQIMLLLLGRNLLPALLSEMKPGDEKRLTTGSDEEDEELANEIGESSSPKGPQFRRDVNERLKVWTSILNIVHQMEKQRDDESNSKDQPIFTIAAKRGMDGDRLKVLIGYESGSMGGNDDGGRGGTTTVGTVPDQLLERQIDLQDNEQESPVGLLPADID